MFLTYMKPTEEIVTIEILGIHFKDNDAYINQSKYQPLFVIDIGQIISISKEVE